MALGGRIRRRSVTRVPSSTRSTRTSSTKRSSSHSPRPRLLSRSVVGGGWLGWAVVHHGGLDPAVPDPDGHLDRVATARPVQDGVGRGLIQGQQQLVGDLGWHLTQRVPGGSPQASKLEWRGGDRQLHTRPPSGDRLLPDGAPWFFPSPGRANAGKPNSQPRSVSTMPLRQPLTPRDSRPGKRHDKQQHASMIKISTLVPVQDPAVTCPRPEEPAPGAYFYLAARRGVCPIQVQGTTRRPALPRGRGPGRTGLLGNRPQSNAAPRGPGQSSGPCRLQPG